MNILILKVVYRTGKGRHDCLMSISKIADFKVHTIESPFLCGISTE